MKTLQSILLIVSLVLSVLAQEQHEQKSQEKLVTAETQIDQLFNQIIQTIPEKTGHDIDSMGQRYVAEPGTRVQTEEKQNADMRRNQLMTELPDDIRKQVERAILDIQIKKEDRTPRFMENRKQE